MERMLVVGDEILIDSQVVASIKPNLNATLRETVVLSINQAKVIFPSKPTYSIRR